MVDSNLNPMTGFWILKRNELSDIDNKTLIDLYQPLVGPIAIGLYLLLWNESNKKTIVSQRLSHSHLFALLDRGANDFYEARIKLEALSLLKTYKKNDALGDYLIYELYKPMQPADFFNESLLSTLLFEKLGNTNFSELADKYDNQTAALLDAEDVTKSFLDVFTMSKTDIVEAPSEVKEAQSKVTEQQTNVPSIKSNKSEPIDWSFLEQLVSQHGISAAELQSKEEQIYTLHVFYGLNELELSSLIARSMNIADNSIDEKRLDRMAQTKYEKSANVVQIPTTPKTEIKTTGNPVIDKANELIPSEYLAYEKQQRNGYVASGETRVLRNLQNRHVLSDSVINILIHYVLDNSPTLSQSFVDTVANDWTQNKVGTPEDALKRVNDFSTGRGNRKSNTRVPIVEKGTDWQKVSEANQITDSDAKKLIREAQERLNKLDEGNSK